jgi:hypothetical protein
MARPRKGQILPWFQPRLFDVTPVVRLPGRYAAEFWYTAGEHRLDIAGVELLCQGQVVAADCHAGFTGGLVSRNRYVLDLDQVIPARSYILRAVVRGDGGCDSSGVVTFLPVSESQT